MQSVKVAAQPQLDRVSGADLGGLGEQRVGLREIAEVGTLECSVDDILAEQRLTLRRRADVADQRVEEFRGLRIRAAVVAPIALRQRQRGIERAGLDARERGGIGDRRDGDPDVARNDLIGDDRPQPQLKRVIIARQPFGDIDLVALGDAVDRIADLLLRHGALGEHCAGKVGDLGGGGALAADAAAARGAEARERIVLGGVTADDRVAAIEHRLDLGAREIGLHAAQHSGPAAEAEAVLQAWWRQPCRRRGGGQRRHPHHGRQRPAKYQTAHTPPPHGWSRSIVTPCPAETSNFVRPPVLLLCVANRVGR